MYKTFASKEWGQVAIVPDKYADDNPAIQLWITHPEEGLIEPLARLSVNLDESKRLPPGYFYIKDWSENETIAYEAAASGWFEPLGPDQFEPVLSGFVCIDKVWKLRDACGEGFDLEDC